MQIGQVHIPVPPYKIFGNPDNPIHLYEIEWTATDFTPRTVEVITENTSNFSVVPGPGGVSINLAAMLTPRSASIVVTPAPGTVALLGLVVLEARRRRGGGRFRGGRPLWVAEQNGVDPEYVVGSGRVATR